MAPLSPEMESSPDTSHPSPSLPRAHSTVKSDDKHRESSESRSRSHSRSSSRARRASFGSVKEDTEGIAQSFLDTTKSKDMTAAVDQMPDFCCPCGGFMGWKQIRLRGRKMSKSYSDLSILGHRSSSTGWMWDSTSKRPTIEEVPVEIEEKRPALTIEDLPVEVLSK